MGTDVLATAPTPSTRTLLIFDFDWTIVDGNTDTEIYKLVKDGQEIPTAQLKEKMPDGGCWTDFMALLFEFLYSQGVRQHQYEDCMRKMNFTPGLDRLIRLAHENGNFEIVIVSDSNTFFIDTILRTHRLSECVRKTYTNPAHFDDGGCLRIEYFHLNKDCELSEKNMCKARIVQDHVRARESEGIKFDRLIFVGDGRNDFCPISRCLSADRDLAFVRKGFTLEKMLTEKKIACRYHVWTTGDDIAEILGLVESTKEC